MDTNRISPEDALAALGFSPRAALAGDGGVDLAEFSRRSLERMVAQHAGTSRVLESHGWLRLLGEAVTGHAAPFGHVGRLMSSWQDLVDSVGAAREGIKTVRGRLPTEIVRRTRLLLDASPLPGSLVLSVRPQEAGLDAAHPEGESLFGYEDGRRPLADLAVSDALELLNEAASEKVTQEDLAGRLEALGPRVASRLKAVLRQMADDHLDLDAGWEEPGQPTSRVHMTSSQARSAAQAISNRELDVGVLTITGVLVTSSIESDLAVRAEVDGEEELISVKRGAVPIEVISHLPPTTRVEAVLLAKPEVTPGGGVKTTYVAKSILEIPESRDER